jgi:hypothetical protein
MSIEFQCSQCGRLLLTADQSVGRMALCPKCGAQTQIPEPDSTEPDPSPLSSVGGGPSVPRGSESANSTDDRSPSQPDAGHYSGPRFPAEVSYALKRVSAPATCLMVTALLGLFFGVSHFLKNILHVGVLAVAAPWDLISMYFKGPILTVHGVVMIIISTVVLIGALKMKELENYGLCITVSIFALIPCISPFCFLGLPFGIWALVVLSDPAVKKAFKN